MPRIRVRQGIDQPDGRWRPGEGMVRVICAACEQPIPPIDEPLMLRVEGATPGERLAFHARCWVWWSQARRAERAGVRLPPRQPAASLEYDGAVQQVSERYQFPDSGP